MIQPAFLPSRSICDAELYIKSKLEQLYSEIGIFFWSRNVHLEIQVGRKTGNLFFWFYWMPGPMV